MKKNPGRYKYEVLVPLKTKAITEVESFVNSKRVWKKHTYSVFVGLTKQEDLGWLLDIEGTPACWYLETLLERNNNKVSVAGDYWFCTNMRALTKEALEIIKTLEDFS